MRSSVASSRSLTPTSDPTRPASKGHARGRSPPRHARKRVTLLALCVAALIVGLDVTIVNVALPTSVRQTGATTTDLQWVVDALDLVFASLVLVAGSLSPTGWDARACCWPVSACSAPPACAGSFAPPPIS